MDARYLCLDATLDMGGWLDLTQQGLSPCKKYQALLGALTSREVPQRLTTFIFSKLRKFTVVLNRYPVAFYKSNKTSSFLNNLII